MIKLLRIVFPSTHLLNKEHLFSLSCRHQFSNSPTICAGIFFFFILILCNHPVSLRGICHLSNPFLYILLFHFEGIGFIFYKSTFGGLEEVTLMTGGNEHNSFEFNRLLSLKTGLHFVFLVHVFLFNWPRFMMILNKHTYNTYKSIRSYELFTLTPAVKSNRSRYTYKSIFYFFFNVKLCKEYQH